MVVDPEMNKKVKVINKFVLVPQFAQVVWRLTKCDVR